MAPIASDLLHTNFKYYTDWRPLTERWRKAAEQGAVVVKPSRTVEGAGELTTQEVVRPIITQEVKYIHRDLAEFQPDQSGDAKQTHPSSDTQKLKHGSDRKTDSSTHKHTAIPQNKDTTTGSIKERSRRSSGDRRTDRGRYEDVASSSRQPIKERLGFSTSHLRAIRQSRVVTRRSTPQDGHQGTGSRRSHDNSGRDLSDKRRDPSDRRGNQGDRGRDLSDRSDRRIERSNRGRGSRGNRGRHSDERVVHGDKGRDGNRDDSVMSSSGLRRGTTRGHRGGSQRGTGRGGHMTDARQQPESPPQDPLETPKSSYFYEHDDRGTPGIDYWARRGRGFRGRGRGHGNAVFNRGRGFGSFRGRSRGNRSPNWSHDLYGEETEEKTRAGVDATDEPGTVEGAQQPMDE